MNKFNNKVYRVASYLSMVVCLLFCNIITISAKTNYIQNASSTILDNIFWAGVLIVAFILIGELLAKKWVAALITFFGSALVLTIIKNPDLFTTVGNAIKDAMFK